MAVTIDGMTIDMPKNWAQTQLAQAFEQSVVGQLTASTPMPLGETVIPVYEGGFEVGYVAEATPKPVSEVSMSQRVLSPWKFAGIVLVSQEAARLNPAGMLDKIQQDMRNGVARQIDYGIFYGKSARSGIAVPNATFIDQTTNRVELAAATDLGDSVLAGYDLVIADNEQADPNGFAFDVSMKTKLARRLQGDPADNKLPSLVSGADYVAGLKAAYGRTVAGRVGTQTATGTKGFVGDWTRGLQWGYGSSIEMKRSDQATIVDGAAKQWNLFQDNMIAYLIEFTAGWSVDPSAFAAYDDKVAG